VVYMLLPCFGQPDPFESALHLSQNRRIIDGCRNLLMARKAAGAVNWHFTLCWEGSPQKTPASGVPTGLPSNRTVVAP